NRSAAVGPCNSPPEILPARTLPVLPCASPPAPAPPPRRASRSAPSPYAHAAPGSQQLVSLRARNSRRAMPTQVIRSASSTIIRSVIVKRRCFSRGVRFCFRVAHASRVLISASRQNNLCAKVRDDETSSPTRETRALPERCSDDLPTGLCARQAAECCGLASRGSQIARVPQSERTKRNSPCPSCASWLISAPNKMQEERKTPEMRAQMTDIERLRHSTSHVLATAILKIWPEAQFAAGPPVENGFYYDVDLPHRISPEDFEKIETEMKKEIKANHPFERVEVSRDEALAMAKRGELGALGARPEPSRLKIDIIEIIPADERISLYRNGEFVDLCAGPHVMRTGNIGAFKLTSVASAYYKGDEKNPQLQRVYGTAFKTRKELDDYFAMLEEAKKRDHRKLGKELELFVFDDDVGPGLPMFLPRG